MEICVDFDGTCVEHEFPLVGKDVPMAVETMKMMIENGHKIILFTMRSDMNDASCSDKTSEIRGIAGNHLTDAINWFKERGITLYGINKNPTQIEWTTSPKAYGQVYIDDAAFGCPLVTGETARPYVDWRPIYETFNIIGKA